MPNAASLASHSNGYARTCAEKCAWKNKANYNNAAGNRFVAFEIVLPFILNIGESIMRLPIQVHAVVRHPSVTSQTGSIQPSSCDTWKKISCGAAIVACGAVCYISLGTDCVQCLAGVGASGCIDCF